MSIARALIDLNIRISRRLDAQNMSEYGAHVEYLRLAALLFSAPDVRKVLDVASGSHWHFPQHYKTAYGLAITGIDIDEDALKCNSYLDQSIVADACRIGRFGQGDFDLITCYSGIEHFHDVEQFLANAYASLRDGGALLAQFPSSLAPFAILNRMLPQGIKKSILDKFMPSKADEIGYPAVYDKCKYSDFKQAAERCGFQVEYYMPTYMSSGYFYPFFPAFILSQALDYVRLLFGSRNIASYNLFVLRRPGEHFQLKWSWHPV